MRITVQNRKRAAEDDAIARAAIDWRAPTPTSTALSPSWRETAVERINKKLKLKSMEASTVSNASNDIEVEMGYVEVQGLGEASELIGPPPV